MRTLLLTTAAFAALVLIAPVGAHADHLHAATAAQEVDDAKAAAIANRRFGYSHPAVSSDAVADGGAFWEAKKLAEIAHTLDAACDADRSDPYQDGTTCRARVDAYSLLFAKGWCLGREAWDNGKWRKCTKKELADIELSHKTTGWDAY
jgi:hypothetical protein